MSNNSSKPTKVKGMRDFGPKQMARRSYLLSTIKATFTKYGFLPLETPAMENLSVLTGKYGDEGDQLLFKVLNSGDFLAKLDQDPANYTAHTILPKIAEKGLRYDLTVPFARYVVMNRNDLTFPFRRYQIQPVWRADRPQKGRYREFMQCDADVIGTKSLLCEAEIIMMLNEIFNGLELEGYEITINNRQFLTGLSEFLGQPNKESALCVAIDKLEKIGRDKVYEELTIQGFEQSALTKLTPILSIPGDSKAKLAILKKQFSGIASAVTGLKEIQETLDMVEAMSGDLTKVNFDPSLARGLSYYTGTIFEVRMLDGSIGSISGGGRYDDLTGVFGMPDIPGVGISLGIDRIYDVLDKRNLFPPNLEQNTQVLIINFGDENRDFTLSLVKNLRQQNISSELYPDIAKMKKQMTYADKNSIPLVVIAGKQELEEQKVTLKDMFTGNQFASPINEITDTIADYFKR